MGNCAEPDTGTLNRERISAALERYLSSGELPEGEGLRELVRRFGDYIGAIGSLGGPGSGRAPRL